MPRIALIADTHGVLDPRIAELVAGCDGCVHAGDIGAGAVLDALRPHGPIIAVAGNNDTPGNWRGDPARLAALPREAVLPLPGGELVVVHGDRVLPASQRHRRLRQRYADARAIVYGHSHHLALDDDECPWVINPGAAGRARTYGGPSCVVLTADHGGWRVEARRFPPVR